MPHSSWALFADDAGRVARRLLSWGPPQACAQDGVTKDSHGVPVYPGLFKPRPSPSLRWPGLRRVRARLRSARPGRRAVAVGVRHADSRPRLEKRRIESSHQPMASLQSACDGWHCRIRLFWIKAPRKRGATARARDPLLAASGRHRAPRRAAPDGTGVLKQLDRSASRSSCRTTTVLLTVAPADTGRSAPCHVRRPTIGCPRRGRSGSGMGRAIPPTIDPGKPSRPPPGPPASVRASRAVRMMAAPAAARSTVCGSTADGMAGDCAPHGTCSREGSDGDHFRSWSTT